MACLAAVVLHFHKAQQLHEIVFEALWLEQVIMPSASVHRASAASLSVSAHYKQQ